MVGEKVETAILDKSFRKIFCEVEKKNGAVVGEHGGVKGFLSLRCELQEHVCND